MKKLFIYLDDERNIPDNYKRYFKNWGINFIILRTYQSAIDYLTKYKPIDVKIYLSFDHDLGLDKTGYDVAKFIVENQISINGFAVHSMNPVGAKNIIELLTHYGYHQMKTLNEITQD